jgi:hypothetical protein
VTEEQAAVHAALRLAGHAVMADCRSVAELDTMLRYLGVPLRVARVA